MVAYVKPQKAKIEESERLRGKRDQIKFIDLRFERKGFVCCIFQGEGRNSLNQKISDGLPYF